MPNHTKLLFLASAILFSIDLLAQTSKTQRDRIPFNADWRFQKDDPTDIVEKDAEGKVVKSQLDYSLVKNWICANGGDLILPTDPVQATKRPTENLGSNICYVQANFDDSSWRKLNLPHDWGIEGAFDLALPGSTGKLPWTGVGWYRKSFQLSNSEKVQSVFIDIDGAMAYPMVWLNGQFVGGWAYGYSSFRLDLTPYVKFGTENVLSIRVYNPDNSARWYPGSGIYRNVWLVKTNQVHVAHWGTYLTTACVTKTSAKLNLKVSIDNQSNKKVVVKIRTKVYEINNSGSKGEAAVIDFESVTGKIEGNGKITLNNLATLKNPKLWTPDNPGLYVAVTTVEQGKTIVDTYETRFGIRTLKFDAEKGFFLNGEHLALKGVCNHHDLGALGTAFNTRAAERQLEILKEMGINALRTSHNMPAPELLDLCDRMGILVMDESFDCWASGKNKNDYGVLFNDWHARDLRALVRRDRNHPSVIQWSIGNEIKELDKAEGLTIASKLRKIVHAEDSTRTVIVASNSQYAAFSGFQNNVDVYGQNYSTQVYSKFRNKNPEKPILASETSSSISSRGVYFFPVLNDKSTGRGLFQMSSYDLYAPTWACSPDDEFKALDENPHMAGEFVWTGFDYLGEPTPFNNDMTNLLNFHNEAEKVKMENELKELGKIQSPARSSYFGIVDLCGFKKDRFFLYQAHWRPELPLAHILPHWNWPERVGQITPVHVYTSGDEAELFLNGKSLGRKKKGQFQYRLRWDSVSYQPGILYVIAYKNGQKWADDSVKTTDVAAKLLLKADRNSINADGLDLSYITVTVSDKDGLQVPLSANMIKFEISGPGEIVATDNGDATSFESFLAKERKAFNGLALVIVRSKAGIKGPIALKAISEGLVSAEIQLVAR